MANLLNYDTILARANRNLSDLMRAEHGPAEECTDALNHRIENAQIESRQVRAMAYAIVTALNEELKHL